MPFRIYLIHNLSQLKLGLRCVDDKLVPLGHLLEEALKAWSDTYVSKFIVQVFTGLDLEIICLIRVLMSVDKQVIQLEEESLLAVVLL